MGGRDNCVNTYLIVLSSASVKNRINKKQFILKKLSSTTNGMDAIDNLYTGRRFVRGLRD